MIAIDLGSNTLRVLAYDCKSKQQIFVYEKVVKTADGLTNNGVIDPQAVCRVVNAIQTAQSQIDFSEHEIKAVTTEAIRSASNAADVLKEIEEVTGISFEIISGKEEARLTLLAVKERLARLKYVSETFVLVDIGGGSTEVIFHFAEEVVSKSFPVGIVTMAQRYDDLESLQQGLAKEMFNIQMFCTEIFATKGDPKAFVATAGTPTTVAAMKMGMNYDMYDATKINGSILEKNELTFYLNKLLAMPFEAREKAVGTGRSDLIAAGILIYKQLFTILEAHSCVIIDDGLREGVALEMCHKN
ncbi:MAG: Exopolyphosphatase (EC [uncultured Sulfurovum sp.]|uniref:Exopolyphosphatase (EC) n=1 Tax=uncultured Sulfurovum sp. TaxID=269237 RepID=A0A6S6S1X8_9BACT|nr:MAG: Exopolyphosphatase (EC [uncultured Sulfurovum sp.]